MGKFANNTMADGDEEDSFVPEDELLVVDSVEKKKELVSIEYPGSDCVTYVNVSLDTPLF